MKATSFHSLQDMGARLKQEKFEHFADVAAREASLAEGFVGLERDGAAKEPVLEDDLARELLKERVRLWVHQHADIDGKLNKWANEKTAYLDGIDTRKVLSVQEAQLQLGRLQAYTREKADMTAGDVRRLTVLGEDILKVPFSLLSSPCSVFISIFVLCNCAVVSRAGQTRDDLFVVGVREPGQHYQAGAGHRRALDDAGDARAEEAAGAGRRAAAGAVQGEGLWPHFLHAFIPAHSSHFSFALIIQVVLLVGRHVKMAESLMAWSKDRLAYLQAKETISSSADAKYHISLLESFEKEKVSSIAFLRLRCSCR
jgi:hypothetical protein